MNVLRPEKRKPISLVIVGIEISVRVAMLKCFLRGPVSLSTDDSCIVLPHHSVEGSQPETGRHSPYWLDTVANM